MIDNFFVDNYFLQKYKIYKYFLQKMFWQNYLKKKVTENSLKSLFMTKFVSVFPIKVFKRKLASGLFNSAGVFLISVSFLQWRLLAYVINILCSLI